MKKEKTKVKRITKVRKSAKGITLIALVVTIIVLLILAGVAISLTIGQNGIFSRAQTATNTWRNAETNEQLAMGELESWMDEYIPQPSEPISDEDLNISATNVYYADLEGDGTIDGVIFVDLAGEEESGEWGTNGYGTYTIPSETGLKQYYIKGEYTDEHFGTGKVIAPIDGSSGKDRFYVMALEDIDSNTHTWWANADGHLDTTYNIGTSTDDFAVAGAEPTGLVNTRRMMECYANEEINGTTVEQGSNDMWGLIQDEVADGWFVPSKSEWAAFGAAFGITSSNFSSTFGLSSLCWSSTQSTTNFVSSANFGFGYIMGYYVNNYYHVRLATTF